MKVAKLLSDTQCSNLPNDRLRGILPFMGVDGNSYQLLATLGEQEAADRGKVAVARVAGSLSSRHARQMGMTTSEVGDRVVEMVSTP